MARLNTVKSFRGTTKTADGLLTCSRCGDKIKVGDGYRWWANRAPGMRSGSKRVRCMKGECTPTTAEMTPGRRGQWYGMLDEFGKQLGDATTIEDLQAVAESIADEIESFGDEFVESADNMEEGFGHATYQSDELREKGEAIQEAAEDVRNVDEPDVPSEFDPADSTDDAEALADYMSDNDADEEEALRVLTEEREAEIEQAVDEFRDEIQGKIDEVDF